MTKPPTITYITAHTDERGYTVAFSDGRVVLIEVHDIELRMLAHRALRNRTRKATAGPCRARVRKAS